MRFILSCLVLCVAIIISAEGHRSMRRRNNNGSSRSSSRPKLKDLQQSIARSKRLAPVAPPPQKVHRFRVKSTPQHQPKVRVAHPVIHHPPPALQQTQQNLRNPTQQQLTPNQNMPNQNMPNQNMPNQNKHAPNPTERNHYRYAPHMSNQQQSPAVQQMNQPIQPVQVQQPVQQPAPIIIQQQQPSSLSQMLQPFVQPSVFASIPFFGNFFKSGTTTTTTITTTTITTTTTASTTTSTTSSSVLQSTSVAVSTSQQTTLPKAIIQQERPTEHPHSNQQMTQEHTTTTTTTTTTIQPFPDPSTYSFKLTDRSVHIDERILRGAKEGVVLARSCLVTLNRASDRSESDFKKFINLMKQFETKSAPEIQETGIALHRASSDVENYLLIVKERTVDPPSEFLSSLEQPLKDYFSGWTGWLMGRSVLDLLPESLSGLTNTSNNKQSTGSLSSQDPGEVVVGVIRRGRDILNSAMDHLILLVKEQRETIGRVLKEIPNERSQMNVERTRDEVARLIDIESRYRAALKTLGERMEESGAWIETIEKKHSEISNSVIGNFVVNSLRKLF